MFNFFSNIFKNKNMDIEKETNVPSIDIPQNGGNFDFEINDNSLFNVNLKGNPTTGFSWYLDNVEALKEFNAIEPLNIDENNGSKNFISKATKEPICGAGGTFIFKFKVNNAVGKSLPKLKFVYKRPWEQRDPSHISEISLQLKENEGSENDNSNVNNEIILPSSATEGEIKAREGEIFSIKVKGNPTTGYSWFLVNEEELTSSGIIPHNLTENKSGSYLSQNPKGMVGGGGIFDFQFKVNQLNNELPKIILTYRRPWLPVNENDKKLEITII